MPGSADPSGAPPSFILSKCASLLQPLASLQANQETLLYCMRPDVRKSPPTTCLLASQETFLCRMRPDVSEGLDFSDRAGRGVIITGIPYAMRNDPKVCVEEQLCACLFKDGSSDPKVCATIERCVQVFKDVRISWANITRCVHDPKMRICHAQ
eukprot:scaffold226054_cov16-Tisochrysis_lutea.AAC.2